MNKIILKPWLFKFNDRLTAVLTTITTAVYVALLVYLVLLDRMGDHLTLAVLSKLFPSRNLTIVFIMLVSVSIAGVVAMICYNYDMLSSVMAADGILKTAAAVFLSVITGIWALYVASGVCALYTLSALLRVFSTSCGKVDEGTNFDDEE